MHARNFTTNVPKIVDLKSSSEQIFSRKLSLGAPDKTYDRKGTVFSYLAATEPDWPPVSSILQNFLR